MRYFQPETEIMVRTRNNGTNQIPRVVKMVRNKSRYEPNKNGTNQRQRVVELVRTKIKYEPNEHNKVRTKIEHDC